MASGKPREIVPSTRASPHMLSWCVVLILLLALCEPMVATAGAGTDHTSPPALPKTAASERSVFAGRQGIAPLAPPYTRELESLYDQLNRTWNEENWPAVLDIVKRINDIDPNYRDIRQRHYYAYVNYGFVLMTQGHCVDAFAAFDQAIALRPDGEEALAGLEMMERYCPSATPEPTPTPVPSETVWHTVQRGDTLFGLAQRYGTTVQAIMQSNSMEGYLIRVGETIRIPVRTPPAGPLVYIVQPGDTLFSIARRYNTTVQTIMAANGLDSHLLPVYRAIYVPTVAQPGPIVHIVARGDTLYSIARRYGTTVALLMYENHLVSERIVVYQRLVIPDGANDQPATIYTVQRGDTLYSIAQRFDTTVAMLMHANELASHDIAAGAVLRIP